MASRELLDQIAQLGLFGKKYRDFDSAPPEAQKVICVVADSRPSLPTPLPTSNSESILSAPLHRSRPRTHVKTPRLAARVKTLEKTLASSIARIDRAISHLASGLERFEHLDLVASASRIKMNRVQKIRAGQARARRAGKLIGRPQREFDRSEAVALRAHGKSLRQIAAELKVSLGCIQRELKNKPAGRTTNRFEKAQNSAPTT